MCKVTVADLNVAYLRCLHENSVHFIVPVVVEGVCLTLVFANFTVYEGWVVLNQFMYNTCKKPKVQTLFSKANLIEENHSTSIGALVRERLTSPYQQGKIDMELLNGPTTASLRPTVSSRLSCSPGVIES